MTYKLGTADNAMKLLRGKTHWIQDKGSVLSVLLQNAASRKTRFAPQRIERDRMRRYRRACRSNGCPDEDRRSALSTVSVDKAGGKRRRAALRSLLAGLVILNNPGQSRSWPAGLIFVASPRWR